jgi:hypothetical protein
MSFIHNSSPECTKDQLDLFSLPPTQLSVEGSDYVFFKPIASLENTSPIEFVIPPSADEYTDVSQTFLHLTTKITLDTGAAPAAEDIVGPTNNFLHTIFSNVSVCLNAKLISPPSHLYPYRALIESLFNYNETAKGTHQTLQLYYKDTPGKMDDTKNANSGLRKRRTFTDGGKSVALFGKVNVDIFGQSKYLLNNVGVNLTFTRSSPTFSLMSSSNKAFTVCITHAALQVRRVKISPSILIAHAKVLSTHTAKYPISRVEMKSFTIPTGVQNMNIDNMIMGQLPIRVIAGLVSNKAMNGHLECNPFNFQSFDVNYIALTRDGVPVTGKPLLPVFTGNNTDYVQSYYSTFAGTNINTSDDGYGIDREEYAYGYTLHAWDLTADMSANSYMWSLRKNGTLGLELRFDAALGETINCIIYAEYQNLIEVDKERRVTLDF